MCKAPYVSAVHCAFGICQFPFRVNVLDEAVKVVILYASFPSIHQFNLACEEMASALNALPHPHRWASLGAALGGRDCELNQSATFFRADTGSCHTE